MRPAVSRTRRKGLGQYSFCSARRQERCSESAQQSSIAFGPVCERLVAQVYANYCHTVLAAASLVFSSLQEADRCLQVHIALTGDPTEMRVMWKTTAKG